MSWQGLKSPTRMLALWLPHWPAERARAKSRSGADAPAPDAPLAVTLSRDTARRLAGVDRNAAALGLAPGMMLTEARALVPRLVAVEADPAGDEAGLAALALWCRRYSPATAPRGADAILIDITGVAHLFGGEAALLDDALERLAAMGLTARGAIGDVAAGALALTRAHARFLSAPGAMATDLEPLAVSALDPDPATLSRLAVMGLRRIGDLARFGRAKLRPRLGAEAMARFDEALGWRAMPISPLAEPVPLRLMRAFAEPITQLGDIAATIEALAPALGAELERRGEGARRLALTLYRVDGHAHALDIAAAAPLREAGGIVRLFADRLARLARLEGGLDPGFGFDLVTIEALAVAPLDEKQTDALGLSQDASAAAPLIDRLSGRLGLKAVRRITPASSHIPERAVLLIPAIDAHGRPDWAGEPWASGEWDAVAGAPLARPLALLPYPEPIEAVAEVPDGPPLRFTWRRAAHRVVTADGPDRIAAEWWREAGPTRDYYRIEDEEGGRYWVYRAGLYERESMTPRWYMHGLFP